MTRRASRQTTPLDRLRRVHVCAAILCGLTVATLIFGPGRLASALTILTVFALLYSHEQLRAAIRNQETLR